MRKIVLTVVMTGLLAGCALAPGDCSGDRRRLSFWEGVGCNYQSAWSPEGMQSSFYRALANDAYRSSRVKLPNATYDVKSYCYGLSCDTTVDKVR